MFLPPDTYSLPVDATPAAAAAAAAAAVPSSSSSGAEVYRRPVYRSHPAVRRAIRPDQPTRPPDAPAASTQHHDRQGGSCTCVLHSATVGTARRGKAKEYLKFVLDVPIFNIISGNCLIFLYYCYVLLYIFY